MARNGNRRGGLNLENVIRRVVREELQSFMFGEDTQEFDLGDTGRDSTRAGRARGGRIGGSRTGRNRGRVTNPEDRRLKRNREAET